MKPGFALNLSQDGIGLLHRMADGWAELGHAAFDDAEFEARLDGLRAKAAGLSPNGLTTKLILPASQILYCEVDAPGPDRASRRAQIAAALEGRTPYAVSDLAFDWSGRDRILSVAVVAKLTLDEAEDFAERHGFNPVSFVGLPEAGQFTGEPFFGTTRKSARYLPKGEQLTRDQDPVRVIAAPPAKQHETEPPEDGSGADADEGLPEPNIPEPATADAAPAPDDAVSVIGAAVAAPAEIEAPFIALDDIPDPEPETGAPDEAAPAFASRRTAQGDPAERAPEREVLIDGAPGLAESRLHLAADPVAPPPGAAAVLIEEAGITAPVLKVPLGQDPDDGDRDGGGRRPRSGLGRALMNTLPEAKHGTQAQQKARRNGETGAAGPGVFGATRHARPAPPTRTRLGLILAAVLVLIMVAVALWSVWFASEPAPLGEVPAVQTAPTDVAASPPPAPEASAVATAPAVAEPEAPAAETTPEEVAAASALPAAEVAPETGPATDATDALLPDPGPAAPDATTLWDAAPATAPGPEADASGAPSVTSAAPSPDVPAPDATALPAPEALAADDQPQLQPLPPPYGTEIEFGPDGLIRATPDGVVTPDGFTLISGRPPVTPAPAPRADPAPAAPAIAPDAAPGAAGEQSGAVPAEDAAAGLAADAAQGAVAEAMAALPDPVDPAHAARKPRQRPAAVVQRAEAARAQAAAIAAAAEAAARAEAEALASATAAAVASSRRPVERPSSLAKAVEAAVSDAVAAAVTEAVSAPAPAPAPEPAPSAEPEEIDEPEPIPSMPDIPTTVTVAKQATVANAIDLGKINLIGVYGSSASRRALVRMPTGRLIKVKIGDRLDGGKVAAIGDSELTYVKNGRSYVLKMVEKG